MRLLAKSSWSPGHRERIWCHGLLAEDTDVHLTGVGPSRHTPFSQELSTLSCCRMNPEPVIAPTDLRDYAKARGWVLLKEAAKDRLYVMSNPRFERRQPKLEIPSASSFARRAGSAPGPGAA